MRMRLALAATLATNLAMGCTSHLMFVEDSHLGLKASFEPDKPTPAELDLGWRRAMFAMIPQKSQGDAGQTRDGSVEMHVDGNTRSLEVVPDPNELMSLYSVYRGTVGFNDPICLHHFLATGVAASTLLANENELRALARSLQTGDDASPCGAVKSADKGSGSGGGRP